MFIAARTITHLIINSYDFSTENPQRLGGPSGIFLGGLRKFEVTPPGILIFRATLIVCSFFFFFANQRGSIFCGRSSLSVCVSECFRNEVFLGCFSVDSPACGGVRPSGRCVQRTKGSFRRPRSAATSCVVYFSYLVAASMQGCAYARCNFPVGSGRLSF